MMYYIDNVTLSLYIHLLIFGNVVLQSPDTESLNDLTQFVHSLDSPFYNDHENFTLDEQTKYDEDYTRCIDYTVNVRGTFITVGCNSREKLEKYLKDYVNLYRANELQEYGTRNVYNSLDTLHNLLISKSKKCPNKTSYITTDVNFAPLILLKYFDSPEFVKELTITLADTDVIEYPVMIYHPEDSEAPLQDNWQNYFVCRYVIDVAWYVNDFNSKKSTKIIKTRRKAYAPQQKKVLTIMSKWIKNNSSYNIPTDEFFHTLKITSDNFYMAVSRLNQQYREIHGITNSDVFLLKANKGDYSCEISKDFNPDVEISNR